MAEDREACRRLGLVDGVVPPLAGNYLLAVEGKELIKFVPIEKDSVALCPVIFNAVELTH